MKNPFTFRRPSAAKYPEFMELEDALTARRAVKETLDRTRADLATTASLLSQARTRLVEAETAAALDGRGGPSSVAHEVRTLLLTEESLRARETGLLQKLQDTSNKVLEMEDSFNKLREGVIRERLNAVMPQYRKAAAEFAKVNRMVAALGEGFDYYNARQAVRGNAVYCPITLDFILEPTNGLNPPLGGTWANWEGDPEAVALHQAAAQENGQFAAGLAEIQESRRLLQEIALERRKEKRRAAAAKRDATNYF